MPCFGIYCDLVAKRMASSDTVKTEQSRLKNVSAQAFNHMLQITDTQLSNIYSSFPKLLASASLCYKQECTNITETHKLEIQNTELHPSEFKDSIKATILYANQFFKQMYFKALVIKKAKL